MAKAARQSHQPANALRLLASCIHVFGTRSLQMMHTSEGHGACRYVNFNTGQAEPILGKSLKGSLELVDNLPQIPNPTLDPEPTTPKQGLGELVLGRFRCFSINTPYIDPVLI